MAGEQLRGRNGEVLLQWRGSAGASCRRGAAGLSGVRQRAAGDGYKGRLQDCCRTCAGERECRACAGVGSVIEKERGWGGGGGGGGGGPF